MISFKNNSYFEKILYSGRWIKNNFSSIDSKHHPMLRMMAAIANIYSDSTKLGFENWMTQISLGVVCWLIMATRHGGYMIFSVFSQISSTVWYDSSRVPQYTGFISFQDGWDHDHIEFPRQLMKRVVIRIFITTTATMKCTLPLREIRWWGHSRRFQRNQSNVSPGCRGRMACLKYKSPIMKHSVAERWGCFHLSPTPCLRKANNIHTRGGSSRDQFLRFTEYCISL